MAEKLGLDNEVHELKLGSSFDHGGSVGYHSIRYDFKPASVDTTQVADVDIGEGNSVTVTVPHVEGAGTACTVYKGNKRPCQKECILIIDHQTGEITLEKLTANIHLKKTRMEGSSKAHLHNRPLTPTEKLKDLKTSPKKNKKSSAAAVAPPTAASSSQSNPSSSQTSSAPVAQVAALKMRDSQPEGSPLEEDMLISSDSDSDSSSSDSDVDVTKPVPLPPSQPSSQPLSQPLSQPSQPSARPRTSFHSTLSQDLQLSESGSDSD